MTSINPERFLLPDVGEGLTEAEIVTWHVAVGDRVDVNQTLVDIETAKSVVELPSPFAGEVLELLVTAGETVAVGTPIISIGVANDTAPAPGNSLPDDSARGVPSGQGPTPAAEPASGADEPKMLVGYGPREATTTRRRPPRVAAEQPGQGSRQATVSGERSVAEHSRASRPRAKPPVRKLARELGVDLASLKPAGDQGTVRREDVIAAAGRGTEDLTEPTPSSARPASSIEARIPIQGVRKRTAAAMVQSAFTAPHVTEFVAVDITETLRLRKVILERKAWTEVKLTPLAFVARAYLQALWRTPTANARWDEAAQEIVIPADVNLGIAAATPRGLIVPNIKGAQRHGLIELAEAINQIAATARAGKATLDSMTGGTTTITNVGVFGVDSGTPILNPGETCILAVGAIRRMPWVVGEGTEEHIEPRSVMQLALAFDHRVIDGQQGSRVLADTADALANPGLGLL